MIEICQLWFVMQYKVWKITKIYCSSGGLNFSREYIEAAVQTHVNWCHIIQEINEIPTE